MAEVVEHETDGYCTAQQLTESMATDVSDESETPGTMDLESRPFVYMGPDVTYMSLEELIEQHLLPNDSKFAELVEECRAEVSKQYNQLIREMQLDIVKQGRERLKHYAAKQGASVECKSGYEYLVEKKDEVGHCERQWIIDKLECKYLGKDRHKILANIEQHARRFPKVFVEQDEIGYLPITGGLSGSEDEKDELLAEQSLINVGRYSRKRKTKRSGIKKRVRLEESLLEERHAVWVSIAKKQVPKVVKLYNQVVGSQVINSKKLSHLCAREVRRCCFRNNRIAKDHPHRARRVMKEMMGFWKKHEKEEKEQRKRAEKLEMEKRKAEEDAREARRQNRKLNFLINQTELYSHFIAKKGHGMEESAEKTDVDVNALFDDDGADERLEQSARHRAAVAMDRQQQKTRDFDQESKRLRQSGENLDFLDPPSLGSQDQIVQPRILACQLKAYQLKGLRWLANLYEQGINGILADEMGLGKTVQSISLLAYLAETLGIWGPFLVIAPASTLHNWQQEVSRFVPEFRVLPYWGSVADRKTLRKYWGSKNLYSREAPFHVLITSYQLIVTDEKYFNRVKWQYMVLDEAQAIKSSSSNRWKTLLGFNCRNRLLLTGTPIQNSMQELWALLHFIMPTLFDSHDEFSEWFSKDIESHVENRSGLNEHQLNRLHMILKPFMLRRVKKDVENELGEKIEIDVPCRLTFRQNMWYSMFRKRLDNERGALMEKYNGADTAGLDNLMNLVMQFRKVCNHTELIEKSDVVSAFYFCAFQGRSLGNGDYAWVGQYDNPIGYKIPMMAADLTEERDRLCRNLVVSDHPNEVEWKPSCLGRQVLDAELGIEPVRQIVMPGAVASPVVPFTCNWVLNEQTYWLLMDSRGWKFRIQDTLKSLHTFRYINRNAVLFRSLSHLWMPDPMDLINNSGKMKELDQLLETLWTEGHRVLIYFQMTRMMDLMEDYLRYRKYRYLRLDGSSKIGDRRDLVRDWQNKSDIFVFLLSTRAGGLGINLTAADTVIFYDSDWNPTVDQQAMDRAHRLGQTKQVTVYRLITKGTIEERIQQRALQKNKIQKVVISGELKARDIVSLLLDEQNKTSGDKHQ